MSEDAEYELAMPFVVTGEGQPYDGASFAAGWTCGAIDIALAGTKGLGVVIERWVQPELVEQLDLIAMRYGQMLEKLGTSEDSEWVRVRIGYPLLIGNDLETET